MKVVADLAPAAAVLAQIAERHERGWSALVAAWRHGAEQLGAASAEAAQVAAALASACSTQQGAAAVASAMPTVLADVAMAWAEASAERDGVALAPLIAGASAASPLRRGAAARARVIAGPLYDALHCLPAALAARDGDRTMLRRRADALIWEAGARALTFADLGAWVWSQPGVVQALILDRATGDLGDRVRAARALSVLGDGFRDELGLPLAGRVAQTVEALLEHPDALVWGAAARAAGRLAAHLGAVRRLLAAWNASAAAWKRRRIVPAIASLPAGGGADDWVASELDQLLDPETRRSDPWRVAALGVATPHLARERPEPWDRLAAIVGREPTVELTWSLARGLASLGRRGAGRGLTAAEATLCDSLREHAAATVPRSPEEAARWWEISVHLAWAQGIAPPDAMVFEALDERIRAGVEGARSGVMPSPLGAFEAALTQVDDPDDAVRGRVHAILRSATRARAARLDELVAAARGAEPPSLDMRAIGDTAMTATASAMLAAEIGEYGLRATLVGALGDLVDAIAPGVGGTRGRIAARALRAVAQSKWAREVVEAAASDKALAREVRRFRKPLEDLFDRCVTSGYRLDVTVPPAMGAWWALCAGPGAILCEIDRDTATPDTLAALADIDTALRNGVAGAPAEEWSTQIAGSLARLDAADTALAVVIARLGSVLAAAATLNGEPEEGGVARELLAELAAVVTMYQEIAGDVDAALAPSGTAAEPGLADLAGGPGAAWLLGRDASSGTAWGGDDTAPLLIRWEQSLIPALREIVMPAARRLSEQVARAERASRKPGQRIGGFELVDLLGGGGMGDVWRARRGHQMVALKLPKEDAPSNLRGRLVEVLRQEAGRLERMSFAKVATFIEAGVDGDVPYLATAYMRGRTLEEHALGPDAPRIGLPLMKRIVRDVCIGLANLHEVRIIHRDIKPGNVFLRIRGREGDPIPDLAADPTGRRIDEAVLIDLGIAQATGDVGSDAISWGYVAPEIFDAARLIGPESDVYALGATIFHVMTGHRFAAERAPHLAMVWHVSTRPFDDPDVVASAAHLPPRLVELLAAATELDPARRPTLDELDQAFAAL